jgi:hypothetical protein
MKYIYTFFLISCIIINYIYNNNISGLFFASFLAILMSIYYLKFKKLFNFVFKTLLFLNIMYLSINLFFRDYFILPPIFTSVDNVYERDIYRNIDLFGLELSFRRASGIIDNIHVTALLILFSIILYIEEKKNILFFYSSILLLISMNIQFILVFILFLIFRYFKLKIKFYQILLIAILLFILIDSLVLGHAYYYQIISTGSSIIFNELFYYLKNLNLNYFLFGFKPGAIEDPFDINLGYYIPLTDIGFIGIPLQFGILGVIVLTVNMKYWFKNSDKNIKLLFKLLLLTLFHYFSLGSFLGVIIAYWLTLYNKNKFSFE